MIQGVGPYLIVQNRTLGRGVNHSLVTIEDRLDVSNTHQAEVIVDMGSHTVLKDRYGTGLTAAELYDIYVKRYL